MGTKQGDSAQTVYLYTGLANKTKVRDDQRKNYSTQSTLTTVISKVQVDYNNNQSPR